MKSLKATCTQRPESSFFTKISHHFTLSLILSKAKAMKTTTTNPINPEIIDPQRRIHPCLRVDLLHLE